MERDAPNERYWLEGGTSSDMGDLERGRDFRQRAVRLRYMAHKETGMALRVSRDNGRIQDPLLQFRIISQPRTFLETRRCSCCLDISGGSLNPTVNWICFP